MLSRKVIPINFILVSQHGKVIDDEQAIQSIEDLAENLRIMRGIWTKFDKGGYEFHWLKSANEN